MKFVAPEQAPEQAEIIRNTPFWPDVDLSEFRSVMRTDGTVTQPRLKQVALSAISEVNAELYEFRRRQQMLGYASLAEVPAEQLDGKSERIQHYFNAVYCWARSMLNERYQDYDATASGVKRGEELAEASGDLWRDARWAISRVTPQGSRIARREYGSLLSSLIDQPQNPALRLQVMSAVYVALSRWEPRMALDSITINSNFDGSMVVALSGRRNNGVPVSLSVSTGAENGSD